MCIEQFCVCFKTFISMHIMNNTKPTTIYRRLRFGICIGVSLVSAVSTPEVRHHNFADNPNSTTNTGCWLLRALQLCGLCRQVGPFIHNPYVHCVSWFAAHIRWCILHGLKHWHNNNSSKNWMLRHTSQWDWCFFKLNCQWCTKYCRGS